MPATTVGRRRKRSGLLPETVLKPLYKEQQPISQAKYEHPMSLCKSMAIPREYHPFCEGLLHDEKENDLLPEPNTNEEDTMIDNNIVLDGLF